MDVTQRFCVRWNSYKSNLQTAFPKLLTSEHFVDVTLACEKQFIKCHKIVLSACSAYFETLLVNNPCQHPIIFMKDVQFWEIKALVEFMYKGEVNVSQNQLDSLLKSAESLQIRGLSGTKQFVNFEQSDDVSELSAEVQDESRPKRTKCDNEEVEEECVKKKRKRSDEDEKFIQITSVRGNVDFGEIKNEGNTHQHISVQPLDRQVKEEVPEHEDFDVENSYGGGEEEESERFNQDAFYADHNNDPGPSGLTDVATIGYSRTRRKDEEALPRFEERRFVTLERLTLDRSIPTESDPDPNRKPKASNKSEPDCLKPKKSSARRSSYKQYSMANMWAALERIQQGLSVYRASLEYGVPRKTLRNWMKKYNILSYFDIRKQERERGDIIVNLD